MAKVIPFPRPDPAPFTDMELIYITMMANALILFCTLPDSERTRFALWRDLGIGDMEMRELDAAAVEEFKRIFFERMNG